MHKSDPCYIQCITVMMPNPVQHIFQLFMANKAPSQDATRHQSASASVQLPFFIIVICPIISSNKILFTIGAVYTQRRFASPTPEFHRIKPCWALSRHILYKPHMFPRSQFHDPPWCLQHIGSFKGTSCHMAPSSQQRHASLAGRTLSFCLHYIQNKGNV